MPQTKGIIETHPWQPFLPEGCRLLMLGSFPPARKRWSMDFFYPNFTNDMWRIFGLCFFNDKDHFVDQTHKTFLRADIESFLREYKIGLYDTAREVIRLKNTASDKDLEVVAAVDLGTMLRQIPHCTSIVTTGAKATSLACEQLAIRQEPAVGTSQTFVFEDRQCRLYRMPSSSRAYPLRLEAKAESYRLMFAETLT